MDLKMLKKNLFGMANQNSFFRNVSGNVRLENEQR